MLNRESVLGKELRVGDTIETWWGPLRDTIIALEPYVGPLEHLWSDTGGAFVARLALNKSILIEPHVAYAVFNRAARGAAAGIAALDNTV